MDNDTSLMESDFLPPAADLEQLIGTLLLAINAQVEADESRAELSLAAWQQWLEEEGYPIHEAIEQFCKHVTIPHQAELNAIKSELMARLHDPSGLSVLSDVVDAQQPEIAENLHAFMERAIAKAQETYGIAGGTHTKLIVGGSLAGLLLVGGVVYKRRSARLAKEGLDMMESAKSALKHTEEKITSAVNRLDRMVQAQGGADAQRALAHPAKFQQWARKTALKNDSVNNIKLGLKKDVKAFSKGEIERQVVKYSDGLAEESLGYMERHDGKAFKELMGSLRPHFKVALLEQEGRDVVTAVDKATGSKALIVVDKLNMTGFQNYRTIFDFPEVDIQAEKLAKEEMQTFFAKHFKEAIQKSFKLAKDSANAEVRQIDLAFDDAYKKAILDIAKECDELKVLKPEVEKVRIAERAEADRLEREAVQIETETEDEFIMIIEES